MIVAVDTFNTYSGNYEDTEAAIILKEAFLSSAEQIVVGYLGYDPLFQDYTDVMLSGQGTRRLYLPNHNVTQILSIVAYKTTLDPLNYSVHDDFIYGKDTIFPLGTDNILISYSAGWTVEEMPSVIIISILRIATLMLSETNGNIGLTGKSFSDNSRTFINYSNYRKYLQPLDTLRIIRF